MATQTERRMAMHLSVSIVMAMAMTRRIIDAPKTDGVEHFSPMSETDIMRTKDIFPKDVDPFFFMGG